MKMENGFEIRKVDSYCPIHVNSELEVIILKKGTLVAKIGNKKVRLNQGEGMVIMPYEIHSFEPNEETDAKVYMFPFVVANEFYEKNSFSCSNEKFQVETELDLYIEKIEKKALLTENTALVKSFMYTILFDYISNTQIFKEEKNLDILNLVTKYISEHINENLTLKNVAEYFKIPSHLLRRIFEERFDVKMTDFINNTRIMKACSLLRSDENITNIAFECGFGSVRNFNRVFLNKLGITPSEYKKISK